MNKNNIKKSDTGIRVLEVLKALMKEPMTIEALMKLLEEKEGYQTIYTQETIIKYITTLRATGLDIFKKDKKFYLKSFPVKFSLTYQDLKILEKIENYILQFKQQDTYKEYATIINILEKCFDEETLFIYNTRFSDFKTEKIVKNNDDKRLIKRFESLCQDKQKLKIEYLDLESESIVKYRVEPKNVKLINSRPFLQAYNLELNEIKLFLLKNIVSVKQMPQLSTGIWGSSEIIFKLKKDLAKTYKLKQNEKLISYTHNEIIIQNFDEDKDILLRRLLKYTSCCEIIRPEKYRKQFVSLLDKTLDNYL